MTPLPMCIACLSPTWAHSAIFMPPLISQLSYPSSDAPSISTTIIVVGSHTHNPNFTKLPAQKLAYPIFLDKLLDTSWPEIWERRINVIAPGLQAHVHNVDFAPI